MISYAQNFEDVMLARAFADHATGFYIDVGAGDPIEDSVTKYFYDIGWHGINIEPHKTKFAALAAARPRDINLQIAASARSGKTTFFELDLWGLSSLKEDVMVLAEELGTATRTYEIETQTLTTICDHHVGFMHIDFLKIDVEGAERDVLAGMNFTKYPATIVLIEATRPNTKITNHKEWEGILLDAGYSFAYFDGLNRFYLHPSSKHLRRIFKTPPNIFDRFKRYGEVFVKAQWDRLQTQHKEELAMLWDQLQTQHKEELAMLDGRLQEEGARSRSMHERLDRREADYRALVNSTSWRMTAPLRKFGARVPWLAGNGRRVLKLLWWSLTLQLHRRLGPRLGNLVGFSQASKWLRRLGLLEAGPRSPYQAPTNQAIYRIQNFATGDIRSLPTGKQLVICVSHELPWPSQAGNQYRIARILDWLANQGYEILIVVVPMGEVSLSDERREAAFKKYRNIVVCYSCGLVQTSLKGLDLSLDSLRGRRVKDVFDQCERSGQREGSPLHELERHCCHEALIGLMVEIAKQVPDAIYYINYGFMTRILHHLSHKALSFVDTHDIFSQKAKNVVGYGIRGETYITKGEERRMLRRADVLLAIQSDDAKQLSALVPGKPILTVGVDFESVDVGPPSTSPTILMVANDNALNVKGFRDFLRFAWPNIKSTIGGVEIIVVGRIGNAVHTQDPQVKVVGVVDSLAPYYKQARVVVNPAVAGTGLKVKTVESIAHLRPVVTWPHGVDGIGEPLIRLCYVVDNWYAFGEKVIALLSSADDIAAQTADKEAIRAALQADEVYRALGSWLGRV